MTNRLFKLLQVRLNLFDEPASSGGTAAGGTGAGATAGDSGSTDSSQQSTGEQVVYGIDDAGASTAADGADSQQTTAAGDSNTQSQDNGLALDFSKLTTPEARKAAYQAIKEQFKDEFTNDFQQHFDRRFKDHKTVQAKAQQYEPIVESLMKYHNVKNVEDLQKIVETDVLAELAEQEGFPNVEKYKEYLDGQKAKKTLTERQTTEEKESANKAMIDSWVQQGLKLKADLQKTGGDFDLSSELKNTAFVDKLQKGNSVEEAYYLVHRDEILRKTAETVAKTTKEQTVQTIQAKGQRIQENGAHQSPGVIRKANVKELSEKDLAEIARRVNNGEKIKF
jgi:hypothetical protein